jgi:adenylosuccinate synthase
MRNSSVVGLGFGDEGKGHVVNSLVSYPTKTLVIRYSGGQQAGHTVVNEHHRHVFSNFGSGTLKGTATYWSKFCTVDPVGIINELRLLQDMGYDPMLHIDYNCPITTPYDIRANRVYDRANGTVGVGVGTTWKREENHYSLTYQDLMFPWVRDRKIKAIHDYYDRDLDIGYFMECCDKIVKSGNIVGDSSAILKWYDHRIFEGSQGLMLDQNFGIFPHVTRSNTGHRNIMALLEPSEKLYPYYVTRAYQTRHGNGPMSNEKLEHSIKENPKETNQEHPFQGFFRKGLLDVDLLQYAFQRDMADSGIGYHKPATLVITCMDHIDDYSFTHGNEIIRCKNKFDFIARIKEKLPVNKVLFSEGDKQSDIKEFNYATSKQETVSHD